MRVSMRKSPPPGLVALGLPPRKGAGWVLVEAIVNPSSGPWVCRYQQTAVDPFAFAG